MPRRPPRSGTLIGGRYVLQTLLGAGGGGQVWRARDSLSNFEVAVKLLHRSGTSAPIRVRSEISILRLHGFPGVVRLLDEGAGSDPPFIVTELIDGEPFPGKARFKSWDAIAKTTLALVETLARLHSEGVVHLDIKPDNVLVANDGSPTLLDFGVASDRRMGPFANNAYFLGTIPFTAPERLTLEALKSQAPPLPSADLYSLGVLLFYALSGALPHDSEDKLALIRACVYSPAPSLMEVAPETPRSIGALVDLLLSKDPRARPTSAREVLSLLRGGPPPREERLAITLDEGSGAALAQTLLLGRSTDLIGPRLTGRTYALSVARAELERCGRRVVILKPGKRRDALFSGAAPLVGALDDYATLSAAHLLQTLSTMVKGQLKRGLVILADDVDLMDRASAMLLEDVRSAGAVARVFEGARDQAQGSITLAPLPEEQLACLFNGPERLLHLRSRAAKELYRVTGGVQGRVAAVLSSWIRAGIARREGGGLTVSPDLLERLEARLPGPSPEDGPSLSDIPLHAAQRTLLTWIAIAWPNATIEVLSSCLGRPRWQTELELLDLAKRGVARQRADESFEPAAMTSDIAMSEEEREAAHATVAGRLERGAHGRFFHLLSALGDAPSEAMIIDLAEESIAAAQIVATKGGDLRQGFTVLKEALIHLRRDQPLSRRRAALELQVLAVWADLALADGTAPVLGLIHYEVSRTRQKARAIKQMDSLLSAAIAYSAGGDRAHVLAEALRHLDNPDLDRRRQGLRALAARRCPPDVEDRVIADVAAWGAAMTGDAMTEARLAFWMGWWHYRRGRYREAAIHHERAARGDRWLLGRISARIACASALMEAYALEEALPHADEALREARGCGSPYIEARAEWVSRALAYRLDQRREPDLDLVAAAGALAMRDIEAAIAYTEASFAYRLGLLDVARGLAERAWERWVFVRDPWTSVLARGLMIACGAPASKDEIGSIARAAIDCPWKGIGVQTLALLTERAEPPESWSRAALAAAAAIPKDHWAKRRETLSVEEALARLVKASARDTSP